MKTVEFKTMESLRARVDKKEAIFRMMATENAPKHAMALMVYSSLGGYERVLSSFLQEIEKLAEAGSLSDHPLINLLKREKLKSKELVSRLQSDGVLTPIMIERIKNKYQQTPEYLSEVKYCLHHELSRLLQRIIYSNLC